MIGATRVVQGTLIALACIFLFGPGPSFAGEVSSQRLPAAQTSSAQAGPCVSWKCVRDGAGDLLGGAGEALSGTCDKIGIGKLCNKAGDIVGGAADTLSGPLDALVGAVEGVQAALEAIATFSPSNIAEEWAKQAAQGSVWVMEKVTDTTAKTAKPGYDQAWFLKQYSIMFGLGLVAFAFMLVFITKKVGGPDGPVSGVVLLREAAGRAVWVPVLMALGPAILLLGQDLAAELAKGFADEGHREAGDAATKFIEKIADSGTTGDGFVAALGGGLLALIMLLLVLVFSFVVIVELMFAQVGATLFALLTPFALAMWIYPPWREVLGRIVGLLIGLWLLPAAVNLVYWSVWSAVSDGLGDDLFRVTIYVLVGSFMLMAAPMLPAMILPKLVPSYSPPHRYGHGGSSGGGSGMYSGGSGSRQMRSNHLSQMRGGDNGTGTGAGGSGSGGAGSSSKGLQPAKAQSIAARGGPSAVGGGGVASAGKAAGGKAAAAKAGTGAAAGAGGAAGAGAAGAVAGPVGVAAVAAVAAGKSLKKKAGAARDHTLRH